MGRRRRVSVVGALIAAAFMFPSCGGSDSPPASISPFNTSTLPLAVPESSSGIGGFAHDANGDVLFTVTTSNGGEIRLLDRETGTVTTVGTGFAYPLRGITRKGDAIYVCDSHGSIFRVVSSSGGSNISELTNILGGDTLGLAVAPATYGTYGGQLIVSTYTGALYAVDPSAASPTPVQFAFIGQYASDLVFGGDGMLYVADHANAKIVTVTAAGGVTDFATGLGHPDGLAIDDAGGRLFVADAGNEKLHQVAIPGGMVTTLASSVPFDFGYEPSPVIYDAASDMVLMGYGNGSLTIHYLK